jgi:flagellar biosynthesis activator protein FlaF
MQHQAATAYLITSQRTANPRELEAGRLLAAAAKLTAARDSTLPTASLIRAALTYNSKIWTILFTSALREQMTQSDRLRTAIADLGMFVLSHTAELLQSPCGAQLDPLIDINRTIAVGLKNGPGGD